MFKGIKDYLWENITGWLNSTSKNNQDLPYINNFDHMMSDLRVADVIISA